MHVSALGKNLLRQDAFKSLMARALSLPVSAVCVLMITRLVIQERGVETYAVFAILISLPYLIPISDFGLSVALTDSAARYGVASEHFRSTWRRSSRLLALVGAAAAGIGLAISAAGGWSSILAIKQGVDAEASGFLMLATLGVGIFLGSGQRILLGLHNQKTSLMILALSGPLSLSGVAAALYLSDSFVLLVAANAVGPLLAQFLIYRFAWRRVRLIRVSGIAPHANSEQTRASYSSVIRSALPMALLAVALPLTYQSDRVLLSHYGSTSEVASYSVVSILYMPLLSLITVSSQSLWPKFMSLRTLSQSRSTVFVSASVGFTFLGASLALGLIGIGPLVVPLLSDKLSVPHSLYLVFGALLVVFGAHATSGMLQMDFTGRMIQAVGAVLMLIIKVPLAIIWIPVMGATGAVLATLIPLVIVMVLPTVVSAGTRLKKGAL